MERSLAPTSSLTPLDQDPGWRRQISKIYQTLSVVNKDILCSTVNSDVPTRYNTREEDITFSDVDRKCGDT